MLSYRHAFHAGNHADVFKHLVLTLALYHLKEKEAPFWYIDTHSGAGRYDLQGAASEKLMEYQDGIARIWEVPAPEAIKPYLDLIRTLNPGGKLRNYPGSPWIANLLLREQDKLRLFERHPTDFGFLQTAFKNAGRRANVSKEDGFKGLRALLPPPPRRALILIDPSYETRPDYTEVGNALSEALKRFATGVYLIWYPLLARTEARQLPLKLKTVAAKSWINATLTVKKASSDGFGMHGSGMFVVNPPWKMTEQLQAILPWLCAQLAQDAGATFHLEASE